VCVLAPRCRCRDVSLIGSSHPSLLPGRVRVLRGCCRRTRRCGLPYPPFPCYRPSNANCGGRCAHTVTQHITANTDGRLGRVDACLGRTMGVPGEVVEVGRRFLQSQLLSAPPPPPLVLPPTIEEGNKFPYSLLVEICQQHPLETNRMSCNPRPLLQALW